MQWVIGIDGGGTKTVGCAADLTGQIVGRVEKGPGNYHTAGLASFKAIISGIVDELSTSCGLDKADLLVLSAGLAGVDRPRDREIIMSCLAELGLSCHYLVNNDAKVALVAGLGTAEGIVVVAGTGSVAYGINKQGEIIRAGGWGHLASDEGSGYAIGRQALVRGIKAAEQRDDNTRLLTWMMAYLGLRDWDELIGWANSQTTTKAEIASLAEVVVSAAAAGDAVAGEILDQAGNALADLVASVLTRGFAGEDRVRVCLYGGIAANITLIRKRIESALAVKAELVLAAREPAAGAVQIALEWLHGKERGACR